MFHLLRDGSGGWLGGFDRLPNLKNLSFKKKL